MSKKLAQAADVLIDAVTAMGDNPAKRARLLDDDQVDPELRFALHDNAPGTFVPHPQFQQPRLAADSYLVSQTLPSTDPHRGAAVLGSHPQLPPKRKVGRPKGSKGKPRISAASGSGSPKRTGEHSEATDTRQSSAREEAVDPLTFQCRACFRLVGDTFGFMSTDSELGYVVLSSVSEVVKQNEHYETSTHPGKDLGSTFAALSCAGCGSKLGRNYRTTPRDLDNLRNCFSLDVAKIFTYQLGSNQTKQLEPADIDQKDTATDQASIRLDVSASMNAAAIPHDLADKVEKTRVFAIKLSERLIKAEDDITEQSTQIEQLLASHSLAKLSDKPILGTTKASSSQEAGLTEAIDEDETEALEALAVKGSMATEASYYDNSAAIAAVDKQEKGAT